MTYGHDGPRGALQGRDAGGFLPMGSGEVMRVKVWGGAPGRPTSPNGLEMMCEKRLYLRKPDRRRGVEGIGAMIK